MTVLDAAWPDYQKALAEVMASGESRMRKHNLAMDLTDGLETFVKTG